FLQVLGRPMNLVKVDHIDIEPPQALLALAANGVSVQRAMDISLFVPTQTALGENVRALARPIAQRGRHDFLGMAHSVNGRSVDPVNAQLERAMNRGDRSFVILFAPTKLPARSANGPGAKADWCNEQVGVTELSRFHINFLEFRFHVSALLARDPV